MIPRLVPRALALLPLGLASAQATVFHGPSGGTGDVWVHPAPLAPALRPPELQGIVLLPVDACGRSEYTRFLPGQPRLESDVPLASRIVLPDGNGVLYRYRRPGAAGDAFGYFLVGSDGLARPLADFAGTGTTGSDDPIPMPVGVSPDGGTLLVATTLAAGGDLVEIELASGAVRTLTAGMPPLDLVPQGLILLETWGAALARDGALRFVRTGGEPVFVPLVPRAARGTLGQNAGAPLPSPLPFAAEGLVRSADGSTVALVAGTSSSAAHVFAFGRSGPAVCVNDSPAPITGPGFGTSSGPWLALSPDGSRAAWRTEDALGGECFARAVTTQPTPPEVHISGDANFIDTLNDTGVISFFDPDSVVVIVGEPGLAGSIEGGDLYRVRFPVGGGPPQYSNLTNTSGDAAAPFTAKGEIDTAVGLLQVPGGNGALYYLDFGGGNGEIHRFDAATGVVEVVGTGVKELELVDAAGPSILLGLLHDQPSQREFLRIPYDFGEPAQSLAFLPTTTTFGPTAGSSDGTFAAVLQSASGARLGQALLPSGGGAVLTLASTPGPVLGFDGNGGVLASVQASGRTWFVGWSLAAGLALHGSTPGPGLVLPGR